MGSTQSRAVEGHGVDASTPFRYVVGYECPRCGAVRHEFPIQSCTRSPTAWLFRVPELNVRSVLCSECGVAVPKDHWHLEQLPHFVAKFAATSAWQRSISRNCLAGSV